MRVFQWGRSWLFGADVHSRGESAHPWWKVMWLTGVDYFSSIAYQAGIALLAAGALAPIATALLVLVTLFGCVPVYSEVSRRSFVGQGSIALLEHLFTGWWSKLAMLVLLGFAGTDFVITMTLSAADAARHATANPYLHPFLGEAHLSLTVLLLAMLAAIFLMGFREAIAVAVWVAVPYVLLNLIIVGRAFMEVTARPELLVHWQAALSRRGDWGMLALASAIVFPRLALGMSGFETGVSVMPLIAPYGEAEPPEKRIANTGKLLLAVALIMGVMLLSSSFVTSLLIPPEAYREGGAASGRAMAYLAHGLLGNVFGSVYDISTILILWFAGASAMAGMLNLIPRYLPRFGMAPQWVEHARPLILMLFGFDLVITLVFRAGVEKQAGAYATGVLVLILSAATAAALSLWKEYRAGERKLSALPRIAFYGLAAGVFAYTLIANCIERPDGLIIAAVFIVLLIMVSVLSRYRRANELRVNRSNFADEASSVFWEEMIAKRVNLVPVPSLAPSQRQSKEQSIRRYYHISGPLAFLRVRLLDDRSDFLEELVIRVSKDGEDAGENGEAVYLIDVSQANVIANTVAYISLLLCPRAVFIGLTKRNLMNQAIRYFFSGVGEIGLRVYEILVRYWEAQPEEKRPLLFLMSR